MSNKKSIVPLPYKCVPAFQVNAEGIVTYGNQCWHDEIGCAVGVSLVSLLESEPEAQLPDSLHAIQSASLQELHIEVRLARTQERAALTLWKTSPNNIMGILALSRPQIRHTTDLLALFNRDGKYRAIMSSLSEGIVVHDLSGEIVASNQAAEKILGLTHDQLYGRTSLDPLWKSVKKDGAPFPGEAHPAMMTLKTGVPQHNVIMGVHKVGSAMTWISINSEPIKDGNGKMVGAVASFANITTLKLAKDRAKKNEARFRMLFDTINSALLVVDRRGNIVLTNAAVEDQLGYHEDDLLGQSIEMLMPEQQKIGHARLLHGFFSDSMQKKRAMAPNREVQAQKKDGTIIPIEISLSPIVELDERYVLCAIKDVSNDRRRLELERTLAELEKAHKKITDSIRYAQRIQVAQLGSYEEIAKDFGGTLIFFSPKDIVSGDFYWYNKVKQLYFDEKTMRSSQHSYKVLISADCTGHGVPGAFMAALGNAFLHEIITEHHIIEPHQILSVLDMKITQALQKNTAAGMPDGMDMAVIVIDEQKQVLHFAGAKHPLYLVRAGKVVVFKGSPFSLGGVHDGDAERKFARHSMPIVKGDRFYVASDGFQDQFGGADNRKYMRNRFRDLLHSMHDVPMNEQNGLLSKELYEWKGDEPQTDDILVIGIEI